MDTQINWICLQCANICLISIAKRYNYKKEIHMYVSLKNTKNE